MKKGVGEAMAALTLGVRPRPRSVVLLGALLMCAAGCTNEDWTRATLDDAGFMDVEVTGYSPFACGRDDMFSTGFRATNSNGKRVSGTVCCGAMKACTVRF